MVLEVGEPGVSGEVGDCEGSRKPDPETIKDRVGLVGGDGFTGAKLNSLCILSTGTSLELL